MEEQKTIGLLRKSFLNKERWLGFPWIDGLREIGVLQELMSFDEEETEER